MSRHNILSLQRSPSMEFKDLTKKDSHSQMKHEINRLVNTAGSPILREEVEIQLDEFTSLFDRFITESHSSIDWKTIQKLPDNAIINFRDIPSPNAEKLHTMLGKLVVVKLNGGLGTSMGCHGPKSIIPVRSDLTFLDLAVQQIENLNRKYDTDVPLVLMNSFNTEEDTQKVIRKYQGFQIHISTFNQSRYPRINKESYMPIAKTAIVERDLDAWYPPGHGDFYESFKNSGLLDSFINQGKEYVFISNIDNLGATVDFNIINLLMGQDQNNSEACEFLMEVTDKTRADVKGGTLIEYENKLRLLELAQVPNDHVDDFKSVKFFKIFNTNNLWINLKAINRIVNDKSLHMEVIVNHKTLDNGLNVIQLEQAVGAAVKCFEGAIGINVPRSRFLPVKKTDDLLLVMSNLYSLQNGSLVMSPLRMFPTTPLVKLGPNHFAKVKSFLARFASIPDMLELDHLTVSGDVTFGKGVSLRGTVIIIANHGDRIDIPPGAILENKIVSGNLRILDH